MTLPLLYFGSIYYYHLIATRNCSISSREKFPKQSMRNRCYLIGSNGEQRLIIPVNRRQGSQSMFDEIYLENMHDWTRNHSQTIISAYGAAPFFEHYWSQLQTIFEKEEKTLKNFNERILRITCKCLNLTMPLYSENKVEFEEKFKGPKSNLDWHTYIQVFRDKFPFSPDLSILDLIFNLGPEAGLYLNNPFKSMQIS